MRHLRWATFIAVTIYLIARTAMFFVASRWEPDRSLRFASAPSVAVEQASLSEAGVHRLFGAPKSTNKDDIPISPPSDPTPVGSLQLLAVLVSNEEALSSGFVMNDRRTAWLVRIGDHIASDVTVEAITREPFRVVLWNTTQNRYEYILGGHQTGPIAAPIPAVGFDGVSAVDDTHHVIARTRLDATLANLGGLANDARWVPLSKDGRTVGWQVRNLRHGSVLEAIGLRDGDTVLRINGLDLSAPEVALEAYQRLKSAAAFEVELDRSGAPVRMSYRIED